MSAYFELSVQEQGDRFRKAVDHLAPIGFYANSYDGVIALEGAGIDDNPEFQGEGVCLVTFEGTPAVFTDRLSTLVYQIARQRAYQMPKNFIGPARTTTDSFNF
ncbi:MAG: hypothetical protein JWN82_473 [Candidatus Saccharibacteria bacterium]|nr:hypothetical protein [Candidatus Saccharibacteria bacterium]